MHVLHNSIKITYYVNFTKTAKSCYLKNLHVGFLMEIDFPIYSEIISLTSLPDVDTHHIEMSKQFLVFISFIFVIVCVYFQYQEPNVQEA